MISQRGECGKAFKKTLAGARPERTWCRFNAKYIEVGYRVNVERILGESMPSELLSGFRSDKPDELGVFDWASVNKCPIAAVDPGCPNPNPALWLDDLSGYTGYVSNKLPHSWLPQKPTDVLAHGIITLKAEAESAAAFRSSKDERW